jgi:transposase-like protein
MVVVIGAAAMTINLTDPVFTDETKAREHLEAIRWPNGPVCVHCGSVDKVYRLNGKRHRPGLIHCNECDGSFTVTTGSVMESSHVPLNKWVLAFRLMASSKKGISAHQLHRTIQVTYKTAWFMAHRIREAMRDDAPMMLGSGGGVVEADETYIGNKNVITKRTKKGKASISSKRAVVTLVERGGSSRTFHVDTANMHTVGKILRDNLSKSAEIHTDESNIYKPVRHTFDKHHTVVHSKEEYVRYEGERTVHTNTVEGFFSVFKRGMKGIYQHCGEQHLQRYLNEFDFRYSNRSALGVDDTERATRAIRGAEGKRLTYQETSSAK